MPRPLRLFSPDIAYHIITRGNNRRTLFKIPRDFEVFLSTLDRIKKDHPFDLFHYCLMSNHVHLLMKFPTPESFRKTMHRISLIYAKYFSKKYRSVGHVFQDRFRSIPVENDAYLLECGRYIERNPVKAGMVGHPGEYPWSSHNFYAQGQANHLVTYNPLILEMGNENERKTNYSRYVVTDRPYDAVIEKQLLRGYRF